MQTLAHQLKIDDSAGRLNHYGSFFFVLEIKGCKAYTRETISINGDTTRGSAAKILDNLHSEFSGLDWEYMEDRLHGELYCDLGVTYHPYTDETPLVGLWRLPSLEASYGAGGYLQGTLHNHNSLSQFGGMQAEMGASRALRTHISFRSSYNLAYEATRLKSNSRSLFEEKDVYEISEKFVEASEKVLDIFAKKAISKSYGVRDEFRMGYTALKSSLSLLDRMVFCFQPYCDI